MIKVLRSVVVGPLELYAAGFAGELERQGYSAGVAAKQVGLAAHLSRWMAGEGVQPADLTAPVAERYVAARRVAGYASYRDLPRAFRTAELQLIHAESCFSRYSSWTCCGLRY